MPIIESKRTGRAEQISMKMFEKMKATGHIRNFKVISADDIAPLGEPKTPIEIKEFMKKPEQLVPQKIYDRKELEEKFVPELREIATEMKIEFPANILKDDLIDKILEIEPENETES